MVYCFYIIIQKTTYFSVGLPAQYSPNANMADHSVGARDEYESEASEASVFCFDSASSEKSCFVDGLVCFISLCLRGFEFLNATRREWNLPQERKSSFSVSSIASEGKTDERKSEL